ncbi:MAG: beta-galactosidase [Lachnospiraceae bacterium]|nr:beta-galactosidase [Lachnospiraceae bacterium]
MELNTDRFLFGGDYNPDQWLDRPDILEQDIELMKKAHINVVSLGIFSWALLEPREGDYSFDWLEEIINRLYSEGISTILATPSGARPKWMADKYPEVLRVNELRQKLLFGERHNHCFTSPVYRTKVYEMNKRLAERFASNPAVILWHISNEYGGECHCENCQAAFREWVKRKYGSIEKVNHAWWTIFWSHRYDSFDQIESPSPIGETNTHGLALDWRRFASDQTIDFMEAEIGALRDGGATQPVTTNMMYDFNGINYADMADKLDIVSWDSYPEWGRERGTDIHVAREHAFEHDYMRSLLNKPFLLMESCPSSTNWQEVSKLKYPGLVINAGLNAVGHGADSVQYFQFRQGRGSSEKFHGAIVDHYGGDDTRVFKEVSELGHILEGLRDVLHTETVSEAAIYYDIENRWAMEMSQGPRNIGLGYREAALKSYTALKRYGLNVDIIEEDADISRYKLVVVPMLYLYRAEAEKKISEFTKNGGTLIVTYWTGVVGESDLTYLGRTPYGLTEVLGLRRTEIDGLYDGQTNSIVPVANNELNMRTVYSCDKLCELVSVDTAETLAVYGEDFYAGTPVLCMNTYGKGKSFYIGADGEQDFYLELYGAILRNRGIEGVIPNLLQAPLADDIDISIRRDKKGCKYVFIQNYAVCPVNYPVLPQGEMLYGEDSGVLPPYSTIIKKLY